MGKRLRLFSLSRAFERTTGGSADGNGTAAVQSSAKKRRRKFFFSSNKNKSSEIYDNLSVDSGFVRKLEDDLDSKFDESEASPTYTYTDWSESEADFDNASTIASQTYYGSNNGDNEEDWQHMRCDDILCACFS